MEQAAQTPGAGIDQSHGAVLAADGERLSVGRERERVDGAAPAAPAPEQPSGRAVPDRDRAVAVVDGLRRVVDVSGGDQAAVVREGDGGHDFGEAVLRAEAV